MSFDVAELMGSHEEADTRIFLHCKHAANEGFESVVIVSPDTDVAVIDCALADNISARLIWETRTKHRKCLVDLSGIARSLSSDTCQALLGLHAFTSCDSVSAFAGKGKEGAFELVQSGVFRSYEDAWVHFTAADELFNLCEEFVG